VNIQVIGTKKSGDTRKTERFFTERRIPYQFVDLTKRRLSRGELENISKATGVDALIDNQAPAYRKRGMAYMEIDVLDELEADPNLLKTPIVRSGSRATVGYTPEAWTGWLEIE
jgi:arsenate reductase-like glutaredoxin family protein